MANNTRRNLFTFYQVWKKLGIAGLICTYKYFLTATKLRYSSFTFSRLFLFRTKPFLEISALNNTLVILKHCSWIGKGTDLLRETKRITISMCCDLIGLHLQNVLLQWNLNEADPMLSGHTVFKSRRQEWYEDDGRAQTLVPLSYTMHFCWLVSRFRQNKHLLWYVVHVQLIKFKVKTVNTNDPRRPRGS